MISKVFKHALLFLFFWTNKHALLPIQVEPHVNWYVKNLQIAQEYGSVGYSQKTVDGCVPYQNGKSLKR